MEMDDDISGNGTLIESYVLINPIVKLLFIHLHLV